MKRMMLTSAGFRNKALEQKFLTMVQKPPVDLKALWIPTAANTPEAKAKLPDYMNDLLHAGLQLENIVTYNLDYKMTKEEILSYDVIYVCGGSATHLLKKMLKVNFPDLLKVFLKNDGVYVGVSAGSYVCTLDLDKGLGILPCHIKVHSQRGSLPGMIDFKKYSLIRLTDFQAIVVEDSRCNIIE